MTIGTCGGFRRVLMMVKEAAEQPDDQDRNNRHGRETNARAGDAT
jgi:hypothetical protein